MIRWVAVGLALILVWAAGAKLRSRAATSEGFRQLGLRAPEQLAWLVPIAEVATALLLVVMPVVGAASALFLLVAFTSVLVPIARRGLPVTCACFGSVRSSSRPIGWRQVARNGGLIAASLVVLLGS